MTFTEKRLQALSSGFKGKRVAVVGDLMLDRYFWGTVARISPEAPVPVVEVEEESTRLGGAANVANNIASLGAIPLMVGVVGNDDAGRKLHSIIEENGFPTSGIVTDNARPTTVKTRVIAHHQHVVRIDHELKGDIDRTVERRILDLLKNQLHDLDGIILEDYNKGVLTRQLIKEIITLANKHSKIITVDPKFNNFFDYQDVTVFKPNRKETEEALGCRLAGLDHVEEIGKTLLDRLHASNVLLTLGEKGMVLFERSGEMTHVPTSARKVADVSGAGDTVISTLTVALAAGSSIREAASLANYAGGIVCGEVGIVPVSKEDLVRAVLEDSDHQSGVR